jgi:hypothetical protein
VLAGDRKLAARARHLEIFCCGMPLSAGPPAGAAISREARERRSAFNALSAPPGRSRTETCSFHHGPRRGDESALIADLLVDAALLGVV